MADFHSPQSTRGFTLIEVLVTIVILAVGLLGLALLQATSLNNQVEAYHRAQALLMLQELSNRIRVNSQAALDGEYADGSSYGSLNAGDFGLSIGQGCEDITDDAPKRDLCEWNTVLSGSGVKLGSKSIGSVNGAIGCIENLAGSGDGEVVIKLTIAWQGMAATVDPVNQCGADAFGADDKLRRVASIQTVVADLAL